MAEDGLARELRIVVRPYATALPLGFFSFGIGMLLLAGQGNGWLHVDDQHTVGLLLAAFVFPLELLSAIFALLSRDTFSATGLGLFATSWLTVGLVNIQGAPGATSRAVGLYLFAFSAAILVLAVAAFAGKPLIGTLLLLATARAALDGSYQFGAPHWTLRTEGWIGVAIFACSIYGGLAFLLEDQRGSEVLPVFRRGASRDALEGSLVDQLNQLAGEAGVRQAL
ncbi:MAG: hypothetical protein JO073_11635 [Actinobacteria bacterium]|nr:hypothetical protein [Actinomycetota bacterium]